MTTNGNKPWGTIKEVLDEDVPPARITRWYELYEELCLRLEQTNSKRWITIPFDDARTKNRAYSALHRHFAKRKGEDAVEMRSKVEGDKFVLYVRRGDGWKK